MFMGASNSQIFLPETGAKGIEFEFRLRPTSGFPNGCRSAEEKRIHQDGEGDQYPVEASEEKLEISKMSEFKVDEGREKEEEEEEEEEEENDGFRTPTSLEHRILEIRQCPPAPRKPRSVSLIKRKAAASNCCFEAHHHVDVTEEIESLFFPPVLADSIRKMIKKARKGDVVQ